MKYKHLNVPSHWQNYWTRYPEGHTILEALISWVSQVDDMVDSQNKLTDTVSNFGTRLDIFLDRFDNRLTDEVKGTLREWQQSGFLDFVINEALKTKYHEMDVRLSTQLSQKVGMGKKAELEDLSENVLSAINGGEGSSFDLMSIPQDYSTSLIKLTEPAKRYLPVKNVYYFDPSDAIQNHIWGVDGTLIEASYSGQEWYALKDKIKVHEGLTIKLTKWGSTEYEPVWLRLIKSSGETSAVTSTITNYDEETDTYTYTIPAGVIEVGINIKTKHGGITADYSRGKIVFDDLQLSTDLVNAFNASRTIQVSYEKLEDSVKGRLPYDDNEGIYIFNPDDAYHNAYWGTTGEIETNIYSNQYFYGLKNKIPAHEGMEITLYNWGLYSRDPVILRLFSPTGNVSTVRPSDMELDSSSNSLSYIVPAGINEIAINMKTVDGSEQAGYENAWYSTTDMRLSEVFKNVFRKSDLFNPTSSTSRWNGKTWLSLGDSITARNWYQPMVTADTGLTNVNYGIGGTTIAKTTASDSEAFCERYTSMQNTADIVTVWGGVNDFGYSYGSNGGTELGVFGDTSKETFYGALKVLIEGLTTKYKGKKLGFIITPPVSNGMGMRSKNSLGYYLEDYCNAVIEMCEYYSIPYLDLYRKSGFNEQNIDIMTSNIAQTASDGLHPSMVGFEFIRPKLVDFINNI